LEGAVNFLYWLRAKLDIWLMDFEDFFDVWGDDDTTDEGK
jgi:hypothetical protein